MIYQRTDLKISVRRCRAIRDAANEKCAREEGSKRRSGGHGERRKGVPPTWSTRMQGGVDEVTIIQHHVILGLHVEICVVHRFV